MSGKMDLHFSDVFYDLLGFGSGGDSWLQLEDEWTNIIYLLSVSAE